MEDRDKPLPAIPAKRYFTIGEVSALCGVKPYVLRYWEQEFTQLKPMKRRGNRRYYQHHEVLLIRRIRELLYEQGFTISGARNRLSDASGGAPALTLEPTFEPAHFEPPAAAKRSGPASGAVPERDDLDVDVNALSVHLPESGEPIAWGDVRAELLAIRKLLSH